MEKIVPLKIGLVKPVPQNAAHLRIENSIKIVLLQFFSIQDSINLIQISEKKMRHRRKNPTRNPVQSTAEDRLEKIYIDAYTGQSLMLMLFFISARA